MKKIIVTIIILLFLFAVGYFWYVRNSANNQNSTNGGLKSDLVPMQDSSVRFDFVKIQNFEFLPSELMVDKGTTVTWTNDDSIPHQIKSTTFNSPQLDMGQNFSFKFDEVGIFEYSCAIHPSMTGRIIVK